MLKLLIKSNADVNAFSNMAKGRFNQDQENFFSHFSNNDLIFKAKSSGKTPLIIAVENENVEMVKFLIVNNAKTNLSDSYQKTPLFFAVEKGNAKIARLLLAAGADLTHRHR